MLEGLGQKSSPMDGAALDEDRVVGFRLRTHSSSIERRTQERIRRLQ